MNDVNHVRQILMNELGLSRESVREEMKKIVNETVDRHIKQLIEGNRVDEKLNRIIELRVGNLISNRGKEIAKEVIADLVNASVSITVVEKP